MIKSRKKNQEISKLKKISILSFISFLCLNSYSQETQEQKEQVLKEITVKEESDAQTSESSSYKAKKSTAGSKVATDIKDVPQTISVITSERMKDQNLRTQKDVFDNVAGATHENSTEGFFRIRGFGAASLVDGVPMSSGLAWRSDLDISVFDRVEVIKGANAMFSGAGNIGGAVNYAFKKPLDYFQVSGGATGGNNNLVNLDLDITGPITKSGDLRYRGVFALDHRDEIKNVDERLRFTGYIALAYDFTNKTSLNLNYYQSDNFAKTGFRQTLPAYKNGDLIWDLDRKTSYTQDWSDWHYKSRWIFSELEHKFNDNWQSKLSYRYGGSANPTYTQENANNKVKGSNLNPCGLLPFSGIDKNNPDSSKRCYAIGYWDNTNDYHILDTFTYGKFKFLDREHDFLIGGNFEKRIYLNYSYEDENKFWFINDTLNPNKHVRDFVGKDKFKIIQTSDDRELRNWGVYSRATVGITDWLKMPVGGRLSWEWYHYENKAKDKDEKKYKTKAKFTPYIGLTAQINKNISVYGSYTQTFNSNTDNYAWKEGANENEASTGTLLPDRYGEQWEAGIKSTWFKDKLLTTISVYQLEENNISRADPDHEKFKIASGQNKTNGFELEASGEIIRNWSLGGFYNYMNARYSKHDTLEGQVFSNKPKHSANLYTNYKIRKGFLSGLSLGGGIKFVGERWGSTVSKVKLDQGVKRVYSKGYSLANIRAGYQINDNLNLSLNINNLFDKKYWQGLGSPESGNTWGNPRSFSLNLRGTF